MVCVILHRLLRMLLVIHLFSFAVVEGDELLVWLFNFMDAVLLLQGLSERWKVLQFFKFAVSFFILGIDLLHELLCIISHLYLRCLHDLLLKYLRLGIASLSIHTFSGCLIYRVLIAVYTCAFTVLLVLLNLFFQILRILLLMLLMMNVIG